MAREEAAATEARAVSIGEARPGCTLVDSEDTPHEPSPTLAAPLCCCFSEELLSLIRLAVPSCGSYVLQFGVGLANVVVTGHLGVLQLDGAALGQLIANVTGFSLVIGLLLAMDTLGPQAYGAGNLTLVGTVAQRSALVAMLVCVPVTMFWWNAQPLLLLLNQVLLLLLMDRHDQ